MAHFLLLTFPAQGHINPTLQFAKRLVRAGAYVTFATTPFALRRLMNSSSIDGLSYASFSDGYDDGYKETDDPAHIMVQLKNIGSQTTTDLVASLSREGRPVTCVVYTILLPWAANIACEFGIPSALLWIQAASVLTIYYHYFYGYDSIINEKSKDHSSFTLEFPSLPSLTIDDLPSFVVPSNPHDFVLPIFKEHFKTLDKENQANSNSRMLVNTYDALEESALSAIDSLKLVAIGPLIPSAFLDKTDTSDNSFGLDLFNKSKDYIGWLHSKPESSVVYVSFGSLTVLPEKQMEEISKGLIEIGRPFLWVIRPAGEGGRSRGDESEATFWRKLGEVGEGENGLIVPWCSQVEVLSHKAVGCFVSHCGWNSITESLATGVPVVAFPQWTDQPTTAKLVEDVWKTGVRVKTNEDGILKSEELKRCLEQVMGGGEQGEEIRKNAEKWRKLAREAAREGGSSDRNIQEFVEEMKP